MQHNTDTLFTLSDLMNPDKDRAKIETGDCGIVLKPDGTFQVFSTGAENIANPVETWTEVDHQIFANGQKLMALALTLATPQLLAVITDATKALTNELNSHETGN